ncbi:MAG: glucosamine-6-phosphate deaminase [Mycoplasmatales bacterium]|nr:glucosamine-6-phosphate deaminase [Mycoplasmatales bacterium]
MKVLIVKDYEEMSLKAAEFIAKEIKDKKNAILGLATGSTPEGTYKKLIEKNLDWSEIKTFNLDEYVGLDGEHPASYRYFMNKKLFNLVNIKIDNTFVPSGTNNPLEEGKIYEEKIQNAGGIDLQLLGIGQNSHIGFNEPFAEKDSVTREVKLVESTINANSRMFNNRDDVPKTAMSMGIQTILRAKKILLLASGDSKAEAIKNTVEGEITGNVPASYLQEHNDVTLIIDKDAAKLLKK